MVKAVKRFFICNKCSLEYPHWQGQCTNCQAWNTITECYREATGVAVRPVWFAGYDNQTIVSTKKVQKLRNICLKKLPRFSTGFKEFDRVLGGGIVPGSVILLGGSPGAGKSTLLLQTLCQITTQLQIKTLYVSGEESLQQVAIRAHRLKLLPNTELNILPETNIEQICLTALEEKPQLMVIDSIQVMYMTDVPSSPGSISQVREAAACLTRFAKNEGVAVIMVGHVTKDGSLAGPKVLEHCVDCSIMLNVDSDSHFGILRSNKNRFGAVNELGVFAMTEHGLHEVNNPSAIFLRRREEMTAGSSVMVVWEGTRPLLVEIQALVDDSIIAQPRRRIVVGLEQNRLEILLAVLHRHGGLQMANQDVFVNVVGGVKVSETSADLALMLAIVSSLHNRPLPRDLVVFGEVGLAGEIRPVQSGQERITEAAKHGFRYAILPEANVPKKVPENMQIFGVKKLTDALTILEQI
ncbi:DNA repair protein RadA [Candidatus Palibaumannia cicadellinicola]|uniref:DNA repair protein RadA n=1 Tax=Candidatus Palibaumannia cicadellinicola TaxID=186490 RepID=A0A088N2H9_9GAMM|nr:DNA repair protein RadA [Candidatus Baumannia cicadellinicola]AIN47546.1 DNA repair protein RadA [Candidatus Baumannia cicadellinicola]